MKFQVLDNVYGLTGYAKATRELAYAISKHMETEILNYQTGYLPEKIFNLMRDTLDIHDNVVFSRPYFNKSLEFADDKPAMIIGNVVLEGFLPEKMKRILNNDKIDQVWCPSKFCRNNYIQSNIIEDKIKIVPHGVDIELYKPKAIESEYFTFLFVGGFTGRGDRKGADILADAFKEEFKPEEKVRLIFKINTCYNPTFNPVPWLCGDNIIVDTRDLSERDMVDIYNNCDVFVSPSRAEGFNMTCLEAMSCGKPVITTEYAAGEYTSKDNTFFIRDAGFDFARFSPWDAESLWCKPDIKDLREKMRFCVENRSILEKMSKNARKTAELWTWDNAATIALNTLGLNK